MSRPSTPVRFPQTRCLRPRGQAPVPHPRAAPAARARRRARPCAGDYDLRSNKAGIAVSGEITLHADRLYVQVSQSVHGPRQPASCSAVASGRRDYVGGVNNFASLDLLHELARASNSGP